MFILAHRLLFVLVSISFFISATEMDLGECRNTFFDDHDTYVRTEQVSFNQPVFERFSTGITDLIHWSYYCQVPEKAKEVFSYITYDPVVHPPPIYLKNSVFRI